MPIAEHRGLHIDFTDEGAGPPVMLLHSSVSGNRQWRKLSALLAGRYRVIAPNLCGYGGTSAWHGPRAQTLADAAQVVLSLREALALGDEPLRLVGHSWGGAIALQAAHELGAQVSHLALYEPMLPGLLQAHRRLEAAAQTRALYADVRRLGRAGQWQALGERFTDYFNGAGAWAACDAERQRRIAEALAPNLHEWDACMVPLHARALAGIRAHGLLMRGRQTRPPLTEIAALLHERFTHWYLVDMAGCGHMAPLTHAEEINRRIAEFLDDGGRRSDDDAAAAMATLEGI